jgi:hypothetical protein
MKIEKGKKESQVDLNNRITFMNEYFVWSLQGESVTSEDGDVVILFDDGSEFRYPIKDVKVDTSKDYFDLTHVSWEKVFIAYMRHVGRISDERMEYENYLDEVIELQKEKVK